MHPFQKADLGLSPFRCTHVTEAVFTLPDGTSKAGGFCDYCYTGIRWQFHIESADQRTFKVGCDCVAKTGWGIDGFDEVRRKNARARRQIGAQKRREERQAQIASERAQKAAERIEATQAWRDANSAIVARLLAYEGGNSFITSMAASIAQWGSLTNRQLDSVLSCFAAIDRAESARANSQHIGSVGDKITLVLTVKHIVVIESQFGTNYIHICEDADHNAVIYKGKAQGFPRKNEIATIVASVKEHGLRDGVKQTIIQRPKAI